MTRAIDRPAPAPKPAGITQTTAVEQSRAVAEVQAAIFVAQQFPRDMLRAFAEMRAACARLALANRAFYSVPNRGTGPSVHLARELARIWGNLDHGVKELRRDDETHESEVLAYAWDQQTNVRSTRSLIVPHARMKGRERQPLVDLTDVYLNNQNVGARAVRECLFTVMPADFVAEAQELCRATIERGDGKPLDERIKDTVDAFGQLNVSLVQIETRIGRKRGQWTPSDLADLSVIWSSIKRGEVRAEEEFPTARVTAAEIVGQPVDEPRQAYNRFYREPEEPSGPEPTVPEAPDEPVSEPESDDAVEMVNSAQHRKMHALWRKLGYGGDENRDNRLAIISKILRRDIETSSELSRDEANTVIDELERKAGES